VSIGLSTDNSNMASKHSKNVICIIYSSILKLFWSISFLILVFYQRVSLVSTQNNVMISTIAIFAKEINLNQFISLSLRIRS